MGFSNSQIKPLSSTQSKPMYLPYSLGYLELTSGGIIEYSL